MAHRPKPTKTQMGRGASKAYSRAMKKWNAEHEAMENNESSSDSTPASFFSSYFAH